MLLEKLKNQGIAEALEAIGYNCEEIFGNLSEEVQKMYASCSFRKIACSVEGIRSAYVIHAVPPEELLLKGHPWEEWFFQFDRPEHHVLFLENKDFCDQEIFIPENDQDHPREACGRTWYYFCDSRSLPYFAGEAK